MSLGRGRVLDRLRAWVDRRRVRAREGAPGTSAPSDDDRSGADHRVALDGAPAEAPPRARDGSRAGRGEPARDEGVGAARGPTPLGEAWAELERLAGADGDFLVRLADSFIEASARRIEEMRQGGDAAELAHALKGASRQVGADRLADLSARLERSPERVEELLPRLDAELERTRESLRARVASRR